MTDLEPSAHESYGFLLNLAADYLRTGDAAWLPVRLQEYANTAENRTLALVMLTSGAVIALASQVLEVSGTPERAIAKLNTRAFEVMAAERTPE